MKILQSIPLVALAASFVSAEPTLVKRANPLGIDISNWQGSVNFNTVKANGLAFVYIKATEGTSMYLSLSDTPTVS